MPTELTVVSYRHPTGDLFHDVGCTNLARLKQVVRLMTHVGYEVASGIRSGHGEQHVVTFFSFEDRLYTRVPRDVHTRVLRLLSIGVNRILARDDDFIATRVEVGHSRTRRRDRALSPQRFAL